MPLRFNEHQLFIKWRFNSFVFYLCIDFINRFLPVGLPEFIYSTVYYVQQEHIFINNKIAGIRKLQLLLHSNK